MTTPNMNKELRPLARQARKAGWVIAQTSGGHVQWNCPCGWRWITSSTGHSSGHNNALYVLRKHLAMPPGHERPDR